MMQQDKMLCRSQGFRAAAAAAAAVACSDIVIFYASATLVAPNAMCHASAIS